MHFGHSLILLFDLKKSAAHETLVEAYDDQIPSYDNCRYWLKCFKSRGFDLNNAQH